MPNNIIELTEKTSTDGNNNANIIAQLREETEATKMPYGEDTQRHLLASLLSDAGTAEAAVKHTKPTFYKTEYFRTIARSIYTHYRKYGETPHRAIIEADIDAHYKGDEAKRIKTRGELDALYDYYIPLSPDTREELKRRMFRFGTTQKLREAFDKAFGMLKNNFESEEAWAKVDHIMSEVLSAKLPDSNNYPCAPFFDLYEQAKEKFRWYIPRYFPQGTLKIVSGMGKLGKTNAVASLVMDTILGRLVLGHQALCRDVIWLDFDSNPLSHPTQMLHAAIGSHPTPEQRELIQQKLHLFSNSIDKGEPSHLPAYLTTDWLEGMCSRYDEAGLIVIDSFRPAFFADPNLKPGFDVDPTEVGRLLRPLVQFAHQSDWTILVIHHDNRGGTYAGSNEFLNACDSLDHFERPSDDPSEPQRILKVLGGRGVDLTAYQLAWEAVELPDVDVSVGRYNYLDPAERAEIEKIDQTRKYHAALSKLIARVKTTPTRKKDDLEKVCGEEGIPQKEAREFINVLVEKELLAKAGRNDPFTATPKAEEQYLIDAIIESMQGKSCRRRLQEKGTTTTTFQVQGKAKFVVGDRERGRVKTSFYLPYSFPSFPLVSPHYEYTFFSLTLP